MADTVRRFTVAPATEALFASAFADRLLVNGRAAAVVLGVSVEDFRGLVANGYVRRTVIRDRYTEQALRDFLWPPVEEVEPEPVQTEQPAPPPLRKIVRSKREKAARRKYLRDLRRTNPVFALNCRMRCAIYSCLRRAKGGRRWTELVGYTGEQLAVHLQAQFSEGMTWENLGAWHVDHRRPLASFSITGPDCPDFKTAWSLENLQPLWAADNLRKGSRWDG